MDFKQYYLNDLETLKGIRLTSGNQCKKLSEAIFNEIGVRISWQTLRRVLGFIKQESNATATLYSLNVMCRFLKFDSYNSYILSKQNDSSGNAFVDMLQLIYKGELQQEKDLNYHFVCRGLSNHCYHKPELIHLIPKEIVKRSAFQRYFIGRFPLLDLMDLGFENILYQFADYVKTDAVKLFVYSVIYLHRFKAGEPKPDLLKELRSIDAKGMHPFLAGRVYGLQLHSNADKRNRDQTFNTVRNILKQSSEYKRLCMLFTFLDFSITAKMYSDSLSLLDQFNPKPSKNKSWVEFGYFEVFKIYRLLCLAQTKQFEEAIILEKVISIDSVAFYFRKTYQLMYLKARDILEKEPENKRLITEEHRRIKKLLFLEVTPTSNHL
jgi:hypothetical protein